MVVLSYHQIQFAEFPRDHPPCKQPLKYLQLNKRQVLFHKRSNLKYIDYIVLKLFENRLRLNKLQF